MYKNYLLLRGDRQAGPYSLEEIVQQRLQPGDLIWVEGKSTCWLFPHEIEQLRPFVSDPFEPGIDSVPRSVTQSPPAPPAPAASASALAAAPEEWHRYSGAEPMPSRVVEPPNDPAPPPVPPARSVRNAFPYRMASLGVLLLAVTAGAVLYRNRTSEQPLPLITAAANEPAPVAGMEPKEKEAVTPPIKEQRVTTTKRPGTNTPIRKTPVSDQPRSKASNGAADAPPLPATEPVVQLPRGETPEVVAEPKAGPAKPAEKPERRKVRDVLKGIFKKKEEKAAPADEEVPPPATNRQANRRSEEQAPASSASVSADLIDLTSNAPDNWMMGIKGLKVTLRNRNPQPLRSAQVQVIYYSSQGSVLERKTILFSNVPANGRQTLSAPVHQFADRVDFQLGAVVGKEDRYARK